MPEMFSLSKPLWEIGLRATVVYLGLLLLVRFAPKRKAGAISPSDLVTLVILGGMATDAMLGGSTSIGDIMLLVAIVIAWAFVLDILEYRVPLVQRLLREKETPLIENGRLLRRNMRSEMVTEEELMAALREEGLDDPSKVASACLEADGEISVIPKK